MNPHKCFEAEIRTAMQRCAAPGIALERLSPSFLRREVANVIDESRFFPDRHSNSSQLGRREWPVEIARGPELRTDRKICAVDFDPPPRREGWEGPKCTRADH